MPLWNALVKTASSAQRMADSPELLCWNCGTSLDEVPRPISRHEHCKVCFEALHCCRLCRHFRVDINPQCDEDRADPPVNKENANFCDWFRPASGVFQSSRTQKSDAAKDRLGSLFGEDGDEDSNEDSAEDAAKAKLDSLFGDPAKD